MVDLVTMFMSFVAGITSAILRIVISFVCMLIGVSSIISPSVPIWLYTNRNAEFALGIFSFLRDKLLQTYAVTLYQYHQNNNPTAHVFTWILFQSIKSQANAKKNQSNEIELEKLNDDPERSAASRRARTRWFLALTLHRNPVLQGHRKHNSESSEKAIVVDAQISELQLRIEALKQQKEKESTGNRLKMSHI